MIVVAVRRRVSTRSTVTLHLYRTWSEGQKSLCGHEHKTGVGLNLTLKEALADARCCEDCAHRAMKGKA